MHHLSRKIGATDVARAAQFLSHIPSDLLTVTNQSEIHEMSRRFAEGILTEEHKAFFEPLTRDTTVLPTNFTGRMIRFISPLFLAHGLAYLKERFCGYLYMYNVFELIEDKREAYEKLVILGSAYKEHQVELTVLRRAAYLAELLKIAIWFFENHRELISLETVKSWLPDGLTKEDLKAVLRTRFSDADETVDSFDPLGLWES